MKFLIFTFTVLFLCGCSIKSELPIYEHGIAPKFNQSEKNGISSKKSLKIVILKTNGIYSTNKMFYKQNSQLLPFAFNRWSKPPTLILEENSLKSLLGSQLFSAVLNGKSKAKSDLGLELELMDFYQVFEGNESFALLNVNANLISPQAGTVVSSKHFHLKTKCETNNPVGGVHAFEELFALFNDHLIEWLAHTKH